MKYTERLYRVSYYAGVQTLRLLRRIVRAFTLVFLPLRVLLWRAVRAVLHRRKPRIREGLAGLRRRFAEAGKRVRTAWKQKPLLGVLQALYLPIAAAKHYKGLTHVAVTGTSVAAAVALLIGTFGYWGSTTYALALSDEKGEVWGYVSEETVLQNGVAMANERLGLLTSTNALTVSPSVTLQITRQARIWDAWEICDHIMEQAADATREACGVYIDGAFYGAVNNHRSGQMMLNQILEEHREDKPDVEASFVEKVELVEGLYPEDQIVPTQTMKESLVAEAVEAQTYVFQEGDTLAAIAVKNGMSTAELLRLNPAASEGVKAGQTLLIRRAEPHVRVLVSGTVQYEAEVPFTVQRVADKSMYEGKEKIRVKGKNGKSLVTATVTYLDGEVQSSVITKQEVVEEPVAQVVAYGTKKKAGKLSLAWPVPHTRFISDYYGMSSSDRHRGIDIWSKTIEGKNIVAAADGKVIVSAWRKGTSYWSYGKYIVIDHGNGCQTLYAHCNDLLVKEGDTVKKGQVIATVGNTGRSTAPHLHFEVTVNGRNVNPLSYY